MLLIGNSSLLIAIFSCNVHSWIFIIIGLATWVSGVLSFWLVADFPDSAKFLSERERRAVIHRLQQDQQFSAAGEGFKWSNVWKAFADWKTWCGMGAYM